MLNQLDIDELQQQIQAGQTPELYYAAHMIEPREGVIGEEQYKSVSRFKVIKIKINKIQNAYIEVLNYKNNPGLYHLEEEECYYEVGKKYTHRYTVPNAPSGNKDINPRMPSVIYGYNSLLNDNILYRSPSPVHAEYTNVLEYGELKQADVLAQYNNGNLAWKYVTLKNKEVVDGIEYQYVTSDWYIIECVNFPRTEHILINTSQKCAYFRELTDAFNYIKQLEA